MTLAGTITPDQRVAKSNGNKGVLRTPQISRTGASPCSLVSFPEHRFSRELTLC